MIRILFSGSRVHNDPDLIGARLDLAAAGHDQVTLVHGRCDPRNADSDPVPWDLALAEPWRGPFLGGDWYAHQHALARGWTIEEHPADWRLYGNAAGGIRNQRMVNLDPRPDICIGAPVRGKSTGTYNCMRRAKARGIPVRDITEPEAEGLW